MAERVVGTMLCFGKVYGGDAGKRTRTTMKNATQNKKTQKKTQKKNTKKRRKNTNPPQKNIKNANCIFWHPCVGATNK
jgi:hypothetical protein